MQWSTESEWVAFAQLLKHKFAQMHENVKIKNDSGEKYLKSTSAAEEEEIVQRKDSQYSNLLKAQLVAQSKLIVEKKREFQEYSIYNQTTVQKKYPKGLLGKKSKPSIFTMAQMAQASEQNLKLVPIRIDVEHDGVKIRDDFTWNVDGLEICDHF